MHGWLQQGRWQAVQPGSRRRRCRAEQAALHAGWLEREAAAEDERRGGEHFRANFGNVEETTVTKLEGSDEVLAN